MLNTSPQSSRRTAGFTLIEVLVVVAIIALLISILLPSLAGAKEISRRTVCVANLHQQGLGMMPYAQDNKGLLPQRGSFSYYIAERIEWHLPQVTVAPKDLGKKVPVNNGMLFGRYVGKDLKIFYCPSVFERYGGDPDYGVRGFLDPAVRLTFGGYCYAVPVRQTSVGLDPTPSPQTGIKGPYPEKVWDPMFVSWVEDKRLGLRDTPANPNWKPRNMQPLLVDCLVGEGKLLHKGGVSALYSDMHAKFVQDMFMTRDQVTKGKVPFIAGRSITSGPGGSPNFYDAWNFIAEHH